MMFSVFLLFIYAVYDFNKHRELANKILSDKSCFIKQYSIHDTPHQFLEQSLHAVYECDSATYDLDFDLRYYVGGRYIDVCLNFDENEKGEQYCVKESKSLVFY